MKPDEARTVYDGKLIDVTLERWGDREREIVEHPGAVAIVAVDRDQHVWLVRQLRESVRAKLVELPAGTCEHGEEPLQAANADAVQLRTDLGSLAGNLMAVRAALLKHLGSQADIPLGLAETATPLLQQRLQTLVRRRQTFR